MKLQKYADYVDTYGGRDRIMRILYYSSQLVGGLTTSDKLAQKLDILSDQINSCRTVMRLFDDAPMLCYTLSYGLGKEVEFHSFNQGEHPLPMGFYIKLVKYINLKSSNLFVFDLFQLKFENNELYFI